MPLVPVYSFGHSELWTILTDPFGILERLSIKLDLSIVPCKPLLGRRVSASLPVAFNPASIDIFSVLISGTLDEIQENLSAKNAFRFGQAFARHPYCVFMTTVKT